MKSFLRRYNNNNKKKNRHIITTNNNTDTNSTNNTNSSSGNNESLSSSLPLSSSPPSTSTQQQQQQQQSSQSSTATSILTLLAIQAADVRDTLFIYYNSHEGNNSSNTYYNKSKNGTLGPKTERVIIMSWKGERNQSRSRLEVCTAITTSIAASSKPIEHSLAFAKEPTLSVTNVLSAYLNRYMVIYK